MELEVNTISMTDGEPSCFYSTLKNESTTLEGYKVYIDPVKRGLVSVHTIEKGRNNGFSILWNKGENAVELRFYVENQLAYQYSIDPGVNRRVARTKGNIAIQWYEQIVNPRERPLSDSEGEMVLDYSKVILRPAIEQISKMIHDKGEELRKKANEILGFEDYLRS